MNDLKVAIFCAGQSTTAFLDHGVWRCSVCGKHVCVIPPVKGEAA